MSLTSRAWWLLVRFVQLVPSTQAVIWCKLKNAQYYRHWSLKKVSWFPNLFYLIVLRLLWKEPCGIRSRRKGRRRERMARVTLRKVDDKDGEDQDAEGGEEEQPEQVDQEVEEEEGWAMRRTDRADKKNSELLHHQSRNLCLFSSYAVFQLFMPQFLGTDFTVGSGGLAFKVEEAMVSFCFASRVLNGVDAFKWFMELTGWWPTLILFLLVFACNDLSHSFGSLYREPALDFNIFCLQKFTNKDTVFSLWTFVAIWELTTCCGLRFPPLASWVWDSERAWKRVGRQAEFTATGSRNNRFLPREHFKHLGFAVIFLRVSSSNLKAHAESQFWGRWCPKGCFIFYF